MLGAMPRAIAKSTPVARVPVPCCTCGQPTSMKVPPEVLAEIEILHLCAACVSDPGPVKGPHSARRGPDDVSGG
jgi:hypothetical protein